MPSQNLVQWPNGQAGIFNPGSGGWVSPFDGINLNAPRASDGSALPVRWDPSTGGYRLSDGSILGQPRVALAGTGATGTAGAGGSPYGSPNYLPTAGTGTTPSVGGWPTGGAYGGASASGGPANPIDVLRNSKNPALDSANQALLGDYNTQRSSTKSAVQSFNDRFDESAGAVKANFDKDMGFLNARRDNTILNEQLTNLAGREAPLRDQLAQNAALIAGRINSAQLQRGGGGSSLLRAEQQQALNESLIPFRLQQYDMGTGYRDANYAAQAATIGLPTQLQDAYNARAYIPSNMSRAALMGDAAFLPGLIGNDNANNTYSYRQPNSAFNGFTYTGLPNGGGPTGGGRPSTMPFPQQGGGPARQNPTAYNGQYGYVPANGYDERGYPVTMNPNYMGGGYTPGAPGPLPSDMGQPFTSIPGFDVSGYPVSSPLGDYNYDPSAYYV